MSPLERVLVWGSEGSSPLWGYPQDRVQGGVWAALVHILMKEQGDAGRLGWQHPVFPWATSAAPSWHWPPGGPQPQWLHGVLSPSGSFGVGSNR